MNTPKLPDDVVLQIDAAVTQAQKVLSDWNEWYGMHGEKAPLPPGGIVKAQELLAVAKSLLASAPPAPQATRCELCQYQHGHQIGCANNPVDIALRAKARQAMQADLVEATRDAMRGDILARQREQHAKSFPQVTDMRWKTEELGYVGRLIDRLILPPQAQSESDIRALHAEVASMLYLLRTRQTKWLSDEQISHEALHVHKFGHLGWEGFHAGVHFAERHYGIKE